MVWARDAERDFIVWFGRRSMTALPGVFQLPNVKTLQNPPETEQRTDSFEYIITWNGTDRIKFLPWLFKKMKISVGEKHMDGIPDLQ